MSPKDTAYIVERLAVRFMAMVADYERKLVEHRDAFGARTSADAKIIEGLRAAADEQVLSASKVAYVLRCAGETPVQAAQRVVKERDGLLTQVQDQRAEIERLRADIAEELNESPPAPPEASHDTPAGKEAAESAVEIKVGDVVEVVSALSVVTWSTDIGRRGKVTHLGDKTIDVKEVPGYALPSGGVVGICDVRKVTQ